jgi:Meckel syndrome type 1 protein
MTTGSSKSNHHSLHPRDDREALSALFDGALPADAARFALKRLDHDVEWREACGRWQMIGDTLRGERAVLAPAHFAAGVRHALASQMQAAGAVAPAASTMASVPPDRSRRRWLGGAALAASVAVAAVLVVRPISQSPTSTPDGRIATEVASPSSTPGAAAVPAAATAVATAPASASAGAADATPRGSDAPAERIARAAPRAARGPASTRTTGGALPTAVASVAPSGATRQPFHPPADDVVTRPWPRSVLSGEAGGGALTVGFSPESAAASPLYPFEPRLQESPPTRPQPADPQR